ncbi:hypothetical protein IHE44_0002663 [Lamprotornis superbus]|uniref:Cytosolic fatty-acid binding proteins domain-containing protein n=1 Tax=Lamprotornis superbus TaxID=245042 RepID=A0A835U0X3_9PASS|nr:hypothetical protein IHE44_0002663 [Lamprotornis superbus]
MPNFAGTWKMRSSENFDELLKALGVNAMLRKVAVAAASKPHVEIRQDGDQFYIKTSTTVRTTEINFKIGESFEEETVDGRKCRSLATWENENKIYCKQTLIEGDGPKTYWTRELANDELILTFGADDVVCTRIYGPKRYGHKTVFSRKEEGGKRAASSEPRHPCPVLWSSHVAGMGGSLVCWARHGLSSVMGKDCTDPARMKTKIKFHHSSSKEKSLLFKRKKRRKIRKGKSLLKKSSMKD